jgi:hypothetical protein
MKIFTLGHLYENKRLDCRVDNLRPAIGRGIDSRNRVCNRVAKLHRLAGRYDVDNPMPTWFLAPIAELKLPTRLQHCGTTEPFVFTTGKSSLPLISSRGWIASPLG